ncbi:MAG: DsbA family protein [Dehalococcoidia bacterium]|nr:DsbA family protein [Dehalococcoidia bacterium]
MSPGFLLIAGVVVVLGLAALVFLVATSGGSDEDAVASIEQALTEIPTDLADGAALGREDAPLTLTLYEDFQCPFCLRFTAEDEPMIVDEYVKTGKVRMEYKQLPILGTESVRAATAAVCAVEQNKFWEFQYRVYLKEAQEGQLSTERLNVGRLSDQNLRQIAQDSGLDLAAYDTCFADPATAEEVATQDREAKQLGVRSTPTFFFNGIPLQGTPVDHDAWREILDQQIAEAEKTPEATETAEATATATAGQ